MSPEALVELAALGLAIWAAKLSVPRPLDLDWERLFKVTLAALLHGRSQETTPVELPALLFKPEAGARPEDKLARPDLASLPVPSRPGERALTEALLRLGDPAARWAALYQGDLDPALLEHPDGLGAAYDPTRFLSPASSWDAISTWSAPVQEALLRRLQHLVFVDVQGAWAAEITREIPGLRAAHAAAEAPEVIAERALAARAAPSDRLVLITGGDQVLPLMRALHHSPALRDATAAVLSLGGLVQGTSQTDTWLHAHFHHDQMDPELAYAVPYLSVLSADPAAPLGDAGDLLRLPWASQRFPTPPPSAQGRTAIDPIDLGPLVLPALPAALVARALAVVLCFRLSG